MATTKKVKRIADPDEKYLGPEPSFPAEFEDETQRRVKLISSMNWYNHFLTRKDILADVYDYAKTHLSLGKSDMSDLKSAGTIFLPVTIGALIRMEGRGLVLTESEKLKIVEAIEQSIRHAKRIAAPVSKEDVSGAAAPREFISPQERLANKINVTIMEDFRELEDKWLEGESATIDAYERMKIHGLPSQAASKVSTWVSARLAEMKDAVEKNCTQAVEAFKHLTKKELNDRIKVLNKALDDLKRHQSNSKTVRKTRTKKPVAATKQVAKIQFLKESPEFKLVSINPTMLIGAHRLFVFNVKTRTLSEYVSAGPTGLQVKGTSLTNWDDSQSRSKKLRKPEDMLPLTLSKTARQIDNAWKKLTTKDTSPTGRLNADTILLRILNA